MEHVFVCMGIVEATTGYSTVAAGIKLDVNSRDSSL